MSNLGVGKIAGTHYYVSDSQAQHLAATATELRTLWYVTDNVTIKAVKLMSLTAITGADTNTTHLNLQNRGTAGTGTTEICNLDMTSGTDATAYVGLAFTLNATAANQDIAANSCVAIQYEKVGTGLLIPGDHRIVIDFVYR